VDFIVENWYLFAVAIISGGMLLWPAVSRRGVSGGVSTAEAVRLINREKALLIDVRDPAEYASGHVTGARNVPLSKLESAKELPSNKSLPLVVVCATGARAARAAGILKKRGFENARPLAGGLAAWREANLPIEKSA
jgi:rhodanese-related sulfurtransferase